MTDDAPAVPREDLHVGVISTDPARPAASVPSCANSDQGDDGLLNPIRNGLALIRTVTSPGSPPACRRPARCTTDPNQYPPFLVLRPAPRPRGVPRRHRLQRPSSIGAAARAAARVDVPRSSSTTPARGGNTDPNAGFVRDDALLGIVMVTDEDDGSTLRLPLRRAGVPCTDAVSVFDIMSPDWSNNDPQPPLLHVRAGIAQDPTWPVDRYVDPTRPNRGFTSPSPPPRARDFTAITGVPSEAPAPRHLRRLGGPPRFTRRRRRRPRGDERRGAHLHAPEQPRPALPDRVTPACYREGTVFTGGCDPTAQYLRLAVAAHRAGGPEVRRGVGQRRRQLHLPQRLRRRPPGGRTAPDPALSAPVTETFATRLCPGTHLG